MHSDMKARNVLLSKGRETAKISDVGVARYLNECATATQSNYVAWTFAYAGAKDAP
jgi:serine/threonine protein kinase